MTEPVFFERLLYAWTLLALPTFAVLLFVRAPFGRHARPGWGPTLGNRLGWVLMESPSVWWFPLVFLSGELARGPGNWLFFALWMTHYVHRDLIYPLRTRGPGHRIPLLIVAFAFIFQIVNGYLNGAWLGRLGRTYEADWLLQPAFLIGMTLYLLGVVINTRADTTLLSLRAPGESDYRIPRGGLYESISCPNYLGEIIQWTGWAVATWSLAGLSFALWTIANLVPRALAHHRWYQQEFLDYPADRRAIFPGVL